MSTICDGALNRQYGKLWLKKLIPLLILICLFLIGSIAHAEITITSDIPESSLKYEDIPLFSGEDVIVLDEDVPEFYISQLTTDTFVHFSPLDPLGRTGVGFACLGPETLPAEKRGPIGDVEPAGWQITRYDDLITDKYLYNRSHVIAYMLSGDNATPENLFTGTRYLNATVMLAYENSVSEYIKGTGNHVLYRVSPIYNGSDLLPYGVEMEAYSVEDSGVGICFHIFAYNIQPGININYLTGESWSGTIPQEENAPVFSLVPTETENGEATRSFSFQDEEIRYVLNTNTKKFHYPDCPSVDDMKPKNRQNFSGTRDEAIAMGYVPCKRCNP